MTGTGDADLELTPTAAEASGRLTALDAAVAAWADAYVACTPAERDLVRAEATRLGLVDPATWAVVEALALTQEDARPWPPR